MKISSVCTLFAFLCATSSIADSYRILAIFPFNGLSHFIMFERLVKELVIRGHRVDLVSHHPVRTLKEPNPNLHHIINLSGTIPFLMNNLTFEFGSKTLGESSISIAIATQFGGDLCHLMDLPQFKELIRNPPSDPPYDLLLTEVFGTGCYFALGKHLKIPIVGICTSPLWPWTSDMVANPENTAYIPHLLSKLSGSMNFWQRIKNTITLAFTKWEFYSHADYQDELIKKYIGPDAPSFRDAEKNVSLILVNSHYSLNGVRPFTQAVVEVGGLHIEENGPPLSNDLKKWLDDSTDGFILISFGSMIRIETYPKKIIIALYASLAKLAPTRIVMKVAKSDELPPGLPSNVITLPWIPQISILQHKNIRAFMTHGGLMGTQEAIYFGVPMIGVPLFGDQMTNLNLYAEKNLAVAIKPDELTEKNLDAAFNAVLRDPSYMVSAKRVSAEFRDRPMTAIDTAVFWTEYVIRHGGTNIRSRAMDLSWWQIALLDVYAALFSAVVLAMFFFKIAVTKFMGFIVNSGSESLFLSKKNE